MATSDGSIVFKTDLDNSNLEKQMKDAERSIDSLKKKIEGHEFDRSFAEKQMQRADEAIAKTKERIDQLKAEMESMGDIGSMDDGQRERYKSLQTQQDNAYSTLGRHLDTYDKFDAAWHKANDSIDIYEKKLEKVQERSAGLAQQYARPFSLLGSTASGAMQRVQDAVNRARTAMSSFATRMASMLKQTLVFSVMYKALGLLRDGIGSAIMQNQRFAASWSALKATVQGFGIGVANIVAPVIASVVNVATAMVMNLARLVDMVFGTRIVAAIEQARSAAEESWRQTDESLQAQKDEAERLEALSRAEQQAAERAAKAEGDQGKAAKDLAKEQKKANAQVLAFDELNKLAEESSEDLADAMDDYSPSDLGGDGVDPSLYEPIDASQYMQPDWDAFDVGKIDAKLAELMSVLALALMAVGAILCFSGINIPLGLSLMAMGALLLYTVYQEAWDKLPQETKDAITSAFEIAGIVLLVLGAVLAFSGINIPLGIVMMGAGAILLWPAAALNWERMSEDVQTAVTAIFVILGELLLVIGAVIAFSGANPPLGIGLMIAGALLLGAAVGLNWEYVQSNFERIIPVIEEVLGSALLVIGAILTFSSANLPLGIGLMLAGAVLLGRALTIDWDQMPDKVKMVIVMIESVVAPAFLVLGAVLAFSGINLPLGIALLVAGALMLMHIEKLDWDKMPEGVKDTVTNILGTIGTALIVIGIILCVTGVGIPLGIALIVAGAAAYASAAAINWDFISNKVKEIWYNIKRFWDTNIAPVFTWRFWANIFKSIINGLIEQINNGLSAFDSFINGLAGGVSDILNFFGVEGWSFSIGTPRIPYLAQGAVIPPNREFMAVLGDQSHGTNIEAPESLMRQVVREETGPMLADVVAALLNNGGGAKGDVVLMVGRKELARETLRGMQELRTTGELAGSGIVFA